MKDYRLSEIQEICKTTIGGCNNCGVQSECHLLSAQQPHGWDIGPRDMIELPCKEPYVDKIWGNSWVIYYRGTYKYGLIQMRAFKTEAEADEFLANLKEKNNE